MRPSLTAMTMLMMLSACDKPAPPTDIAKPADTPPASASVVATPPAPSSAAPAVATAPAPSETVAVAVDAGKAKPAADAGAAAVAAALKPASKHVPGKNFALDLTSPGCKAGADCAMTIKLVAAGDFHVNKEYPYKFTANAAPGVEFLGKGTATTFTRAAGDFVEQGEKAGTMTVRFKPSAAGEARVGGVYKFSVCSADQCQIEQETIDLAVPVL